MNSRDECPAESKSYKVPLPNNNYATVFLKDAMSVDEFLQAACARKNLNPMEHFVRVKKRRDMEDHNYFVPHRNDLIETYVSIHRYTSFFLSLCLSRSLLYLPYRWLLLQKFIKPLRKCVVQNSLGQHEYLMHCFNI